MKSLVLPFIETLKRNLKNSPQFIQAILGPRQVGKTTTISHFLEHEYGKNYHYFSADQLSGNGVSWLTEKWNQARSDRCLIVIDEIQKIENWSEIIKKFWDEEKKSKHPIPCVLLGSSSLDLHMGLSESLTGRFQLIPAHHWNFSESRQAYDLSFEEFLKYGGYPGSYPLRKDTLDWAQYVRHSIINTVIEKDILNYKRVKSPALFKQCFDILIAYPAQEISYTKLLGQLQDKGNTDLIKHYIQLFEGAYLIKALNKYSASKIKKRTSAPKIVPLCPAFGFMQDLHEYDSEQRGHVFEAVVGSTLNRLGFELMYWRDGNHEVDYVLKFGKKIWAIEVKSGRKKKMFGLGEFIKQFPVATPIVVTPENYFDLENDPHKFLNL